MTRITRSEKKAYLDKTKPLCEAIDRNAISRGLGIASEWNEDSGSYEYAVYFKSPTGEPSVVWMLVAYDGTEVVFLAPNLPTRTAKSVRGIDVMFGWLEGCINPLGSLRKVSSAK